MEQAQEYHHQLIESVADHDDELTETYLLDENAVTPEMLKRALRAATLDISITPVLAGSAFKNKGVQPLLDAVVDYLPSPLDVPPIHGIDPRTDHELSRRPALDEPFAALAFKVMSDPYVGKLTYIRVYSGLLKAGDRVMNTTTGKTERISRILQMHANHREEREEIVAGEIAALVGVKNTTTGDTLVGRDRPDQARVDGVPGPGDLGRRRAEDEGRPGQARRRASSASPRRTPTFRVRTDEETGQTLISGMGELHLEIIVDRLKREFNVDANVGRPQVAYRETMSKARREDPGQVRPPDGRPRPVRPRRDQPRADAGRGLRVRRQDRRREDPEGVHPVHRPRDPGGDGVGRARRLPGRGHPRRARRRLVPRRRLERDRLQGRRLDGPQGGA